MMMVSFSYDNCLKCLWLWSHLLMMMVSLAYDDGLTCIWWWSQLNQTCLYICLSHGLTFLPINGLSLLLLLMHINHWSHPICFMIMGSACIQNYKSFKLYQWSQLIQTYYYLLFIRLNKSKVSFYNLLDQVLNGFKM